MVSLAESCGLRDDLRTVFGDDGDLVLAFSISLMLSERGQSVGIEMEFNLARTLLGITDGHTLESMKRRIRTSCDQENMDLLYSCRIGRSDRIVQSCTSLGPELHDSKLAYGAVISTDLDGIPVAVHPIRRNGDVADHITSCHGWLVASGAQDPTLLLRDCHLDGGQLNRMVEAGIRFLSLQGTSDPDDRRAISRAVKSRNSKECIRCHDGDRFVVIEDAVSADGRSDAPDGTVLTRWTCIPISNRDAERRQEVQDDIGAIVRELNGMAASEALVRFEEVPGEYARFIDVGAKGGALKFRVKTKSLTAWMNREKAFIMLSRGIDDWSEAMSVRGCRDAPDRLIRVVTDHLASFDFDTDDMHDERNSAIWFTATVLWTTAERRLRESGCGLPLHIILQTLKGVSAIRIQDSWIISAIPEMCVKAFESLRVTVPQPNLRLIWHDLDGLDGTAVSYTMADRHPSVSETRTPDSRGPADRTPGARIGTSILTSHAFA